MKTLLITLALIAPAAYAATDVEIDCSSLTNGQAQMLEETMTNAALCDLELLCRGQSQMLKILARQQKLTGLDAVIAQNRASAAALRGSSFGLEVLQRNLRGEGKSCSR